LKNAPKLQKQEQGWAAEGEERAKLPSPEALCIIPNLPNIATLFLKNPLKMQKIGLGMHKERVFRRRMSRFPALNIPLPLQQFKY
jgi:hypothetical protein